MQIQTGWIWQIQKGRRKDTARQVYRDRHTGRLVQSGMQTNRYTVFTKTFKRTIRSRLMKNLDS